MLSFIKDKQIYFWLLLLTSIGIGLQVVIYKIAIIALLLQWLLELGYKQKIATLKNNNFGIGLTLLYLLYVISILWSDNKEVAILDIILKSPLLIFPLVVLSQRPLSVKLTNQILLSFALSSVCLNLFCLGSSYFSFLETGEINNFFYDSLVVNMHTTSQSMFTCFSIVLFVYFFIKEKLLPNWITCSVVSIQLIFVLLLSSRIQILIMIVIAIGYFISYYYKRKKLGFGLLYTGVLFVFMYITINILDHLSIHRYKQVVSVFNNTEGGHETLDPRQFIWEEGLSVIRNNWLFGTGLGDAKETLSERYSKLILKNPVAENLVDSTVMRLQQTKKIVGYLKERAINSDSSYEEELIDYAKTRLKRKNYAYKRAFKRGYNFHNQYLQTFAAIGVFGVLILCYLLAYMFIISIKNKDYLAISFLFIVATSFLTESMFERQAGVAFFSFFYVLLIQRINPNKFS